MSIVLCTYYDNTWGKSEEHQVGKSLNNIYNNKMINLKK